jgi:large subunit ribosomal protein L28
MPPIVHQYLALTYLDKFATLAKLFKERIVSYACDITGKGKQFGNNVPFSQKKTRKVWKPNLQAKTIILGGQKVRLKLATSTIRTLKKWEREEVARQAKLQETKAAPAPKSAPAAA